MLAAVVAAVLQRHTELVTVFVAAMLTPTQEEAVPELVAPVKMSIGQQIQETAGMVTTAVLVVARCPVILLVATALGLHVNPALQA